MRDVVPRGFKKLIEEKDTQLALLNDDLTIAQQNAVALEQESLELQAEVRRLKTRTVTVVVSFCESFHCCWLSLRITIKMSVSIQRSIVEQVYFNGESVPSVHFKGPAECLMASDVWRAIGYEHNAGVKAIQRPDKWFLINTRCD